MLSLIYLYFSYRQHALFPGAVAVAPADADKAPVATTPVVEDAPSYKLAA